MTRRLASFLVRLLLTGPLSVRAWAADVYPVAILRFSERGREVAEQTRR